MLRALNRFKGAIQKRYFSDDFILDEIEEPPNKPEKPSEVVRLLPISKHPIFPKHFIRFRLSPENFKFMVSDQSSTLVSAFILKPKDDVKELESQLSLNSIFPLKGIDSVYTIGSICTTSFNKFDRTITLKPVNRTKLIEVIEPSTAEIPFPLVKLQHYDETPQQARSEEDKAILKLLAQQLDELRTLLSPQELTTLELFAQRFNMKYEEDFLNYVGVILSYMCDTAKVQNIFEPDTFSMRLKLTYELVQEHVQMRNSMRKLQDEAQAKMQKASEEHMYKEILSLIKNKLGYDKDEKETLKIKYSKNLEGKNVPQHIQKIIDEEMGRLMMTDKNSSEFHVIRTYLDWLTCLPYGVQTEETIDLKKAREVLDRDHYGMKDVKERILEFIAVSKLKGSSTGKILCFVGPPGVGKTSIAKSIAEALNRKYHRISLGGLDDVAELKGHRRTYIGAQPGKLITALKQAGSENPVILIDEIDKVGRRNFQGSPENALLEILDPQQNFSFNDHYLDTTVDLSKVLFLCTANFPDDINPVLLDRMDVIRVQGYTAEEKSNILNRHLLPEIINKCSLSDKSEKYEITEPAKEVLIRDYCREAGVRSLQKIVTRILEKITKKIVEGVEEKIVVTPENLITFAGRPEHAHSKIYDITPSGVVMGLAYTSMGGSTLYIEVAKSKFTGDETEGKVQITGNLKQVMSESVHIAYTFAKKLASEKGNNFLDKHSIHIHVPEGATPKDGPSAGITITTALLSLAFDKPVIPDLAMTGEISLTGKVLPIGGLKEKIVAAKRDGVKRVIIPKQNKYHWDELADILKEGIEVSFVEEYSEVFKIAFNNSL
ncbi:LON_3 [Blepharisma stoltei]|uniref:Lon protease homolog n=1 Tax=Blepharisma stoltei TaxID=1481888 RepID=A0AAU9K9X5_9CILI|nr:unnamed protein product [Blepharisma stoltei]